MNKMLLFSIVLFLLFIWAFYIEPNLLVVRRHKLDIQGLKNMKIVFVSDFHIAKGDLKRLRKIVNAINKEEPDLVLSGGDYIKGHTGRSTLDINILAQELSNIKAPVITVLGNHDCLYGKEEVKRILEENGITVLDNSNTKFGDLYIAGVDDLKTGSPDSKKALDGTQEPRILLTHTPDVYYDIKDDVNLILAGHVHGGQVSFPLIGAPIVPSKYGSKFAGGFIKETNNTMFITKGLGTSILTVRFCSIPEIVVFAVNEQ